MTEERIDDAIPRLLRLLAERLECFIEGDEAALETLAESIEQEGFAPEDVQAAILLLRSLAGIRATSEPAVETPAGKHALRVLSEEERDLLTPEAWGYLLDLRHRGSLDDQQVERVLDLLAGSGTRPVDVEMAREAATRVALSGGPPGTLGEHPHGDFDIVH